MRGGIKGAVLGGKYARDQAFPGDDDKEKKNKEIDTEEV